MYYIIKITLTSRHLFAWGRLELLRRGCAGQRRSAWRLLHLHQASQRHRGYPLTNGRRICCISFARQRTALQTSSGKSVPTKTTMPSRRSGATRVCIVLVVFALPVHSFIAVVYARAPPSFQARYFSFRPAPIASPTPYAPSPSPAPAHSTASLNISIDSALNSRSPSPFLSSSPSPSTTNGGPLLRIPTTGNPALFSNELEYLYTGAGLGEAFEFLFDTSESRDLLSNEENRIDKLRKDLVYMWRSRLYSDIRISLSGTFSSSNPEHTTAVFSTHRFILVSRSPYFRAQLLTWGQLQGAKTHINANSPTLGEPLTISLPSPPFTPASLHFTLGYIYTGTLHFSHRTFDLDTAFSILRASLYLSLPALTAEIQARIVYEMLHGLFHAFLEFNAYEGITNAKWGTGGCRCRQCARRVPRTLEFAIADDVQNKYLERGARRALVGLFGEGWCTSEFAGLPQKTRDSVLKGLAKRTTPGNVFSLLFAAQHALRKLDSVIDAWADVVREMATSARKSIDECLVRESDACFEDAEWVTLLQGDGVGFGDSERVGWVMESLKRGMSEKHAGVVYQVCHITSRSPPSFLATLDYSVVYSASTSSYRCHCYPPTFNLPDPHLRRRRSNGLTQVHS